MALVGVAPGSILGPRYLCVIQPLFQMNQNVIVFKVEMKHVLSIVASV